MMRALLLQLLAAWRGARLDDPITERQAAHLLRAAIVAAGLTNYFCERFRPRRTTYPSGFSVSRPQWQWPEGHRTATPIVPPWRKARAA